MITCKRIIDAAIEVEQALLEGSSASDASEFWASPEVTEAEAAVEDYYDASSWDRTESRAEAALGQSATYDLDWSSNSSA
jgi:hypothetical protein